MWSVGVILTFCDDLKTFFPLLAFVGNVLYWTPLNSSSYSWSCWVCCVCSSIIPTYWVSTLTIHKGGAISQSADTSNADADEDVAVVCGSLCFSCPPTIVDEQCKVNVIVGVLIWKNEKWCSLSLVDTVISDQCANGFQQQLLKYRGIQYAYFWVF